MARGPYIGRIEPKLRQTRPMVFGGGAAEHRPTWFMLLRLRLADPYAGDVPARNPMDGF